MAVARRRSPLSMRSGRARRRAEGRRTLVGQATSMALALGHGSAGTLAASAGTLALGGVRGTLPTSLPLLPVAPLPIGDTPPADDGVPAGRLRRCVFRRLDAVPAERAGGPTTYAVMCLYLDAAEPTGLGDLVSAQHACGTCVFPGIFRPDEA